MKQRNLILIGLGLIVIAVILSLYARSIYRTGTPSDTENGEDTTVDGETPASAAGLTYTQAVIAYKDRRIQFDETCAMTPNQISLKNNITIMLDNRSSSSRSIYLDRVAYNLSGFGFKLVKLNKSPLPHTVVVDCGTGRNTGKIILQ